MSNCRRDDGWADGGVPRALMNSACQREDFRAAVSYVRTLAEVDPARIAMWGSPVSLAVINSPDAMPGMAAISPPGATWRNEVCAPHRPVSALRTSPGRFAGSTVRPSIASSRTTMSTRPRSAARPRGRSHAGELCTYRGGHFAFTAEEVFDFPARF